MVITITGLSHKTAPIELRERLHIPEEHFPNALQRLQNKVPEGLIFSTCNRFEIMANNDSLEASRDDLIHFISDVREISAHEFEQFLYHHSGPDAVKHVFRVTSSLDSMVVGEPQILGQMKQFFALAQKHRSIGFTLNSVMERAFMVAKKVRTETMIASNAVSVSSVAVELACKIFGRLDGKTALIVGAGKMSVHAIRHLQSRGIRLILVTNRTFQNAAELAESIQGRAVPFESLADCLAEADIVISSTGSTNFIIRKEHVHRAMSIRKNKPIFLIDIAVPRDIDPQINEIDNIFLYDIDDLNNVADTNRKEREKEAVRAEEIVAREAELFWNRLKTFDIAPTIREIQERIDLLREIELQRTLKKLGPLTPEQTEALESLTTSLTNKLTQSSFAELRQLASQPDGFEKIELIRKLFKL
jgi:glutamyl-tRNA reductase